MADPLAVEPGTPPEEAVPPDRVDPDAIDADVVDIRPERRDTASRATDTSPGPIESEPSAAAGDSAEDGTIRGEGSDHDVIPVSTGRRRTRMYFGFLFLALILGFLIWFIASNTEQNDNGSFFGRSDAGWSAAVASASFVR